MAVKEVLHESGIHNVTGRNPLSLLRTVSLPVHQVLATTATVMNRQEPLHRIHWTANDEPGGWWGSWGRDQGTLHRFDQGHMKSRDLGSLRHTAAGLTTWKIGKGPRKWGANLWDSTRKGRSLEDSHTFCPGLWEGAGSADDQLPS